jgi:predicted DNA-binding protein
MKGKVVTFRPTFEMRERLERLAEATGHSLSYHIEKAIDAHLPELEVRYARELRELAARQNAGDGSRKPNSSKGISDKTHKEISEAAARGVPGVPPKKTKAQ